MTWLPTGDHTLTLEHAFYPVFLQEFISCLRIAGSQNKAAQDQALGNCQCAIKPLPALQCLKELWLLTLYLAAQNHQTIFQPLSPTCQ